MRGVPRAGLIPAETRGMMFSKRNRRMSILLVAAAAVFALTLFVVLKLESAPRPAGAHDCGSVTRVVTLATLILSALAILLKMEAHDRRARDRGHAIREDVHAVAARAEQVAENTEQTRVVVAEKAAAVAADVSEIRSQTNGPLARQVAAAVAEAMEPVRQEIADLNRRIRERP